MSVKYYKEIVFFVILNFTVLGYSQHNLEIDSILIHICADKYQETKGRKSGYYNYSCESNSVNFEYYPEKNSYESKTFMKWSCFRKYNFDSLVKHEDDSVIIKDYHVIPEELINDLLTQIQIDKCYDSVSTQNSILSDSGHCKLSHKDFEIDEKWLEQNINRREILERAEIHGEKWKFRSKYSTREDRIKAFNGYSNIDSLNLFLSDFQKPLGVINSSNGSKSISIEITCNGNAIVSLKKVFHPLRGQSAWINTISNRQIYNPEINQIVELLFPKRFLYKDIIKHEYIKDSYIYWILERWN